MQKLLLLFGLILSAVTSLRAQDTLGLRRDSAQIESKAADTLKKKKYINPGKVAGKRALFRSMIVPGLGQIGNGITVYRLAKVAGIYTGATLLTLSYIDNTRNYHTVLEELTYRNNNNGKASPDGVFRNYQTEGLLPAKDTFRRNREVIIFSYVGLYLLNAVEAYIDARLKYFNVDDIAVQINPDIINSQPLYGLTQPVPGIKLTLTF